MYLVAIGWLYVALMMAVVEATSTQGTLLGALFTFLLYGLGPVALVLYLLGTPVRRKKRLADEAEQAHAAASTGAAQAQTAASTVAAQAPAAASAGDAPPDGGSLPAGDAIAPERKEA